MSGYLDAIMARMSAGPTPADVAHEHPALVKATPTVWCAECGGPSDVADVFEDEDDFARYRVTLLDCGHQEATPR